MLIFILALGDNDFNGGDVCMCYKIKGEEAKLLTLLLFFQKTLGLKARRYARQVPVSYLP